MFYLQVIVDEEPDARYVLTGSNNLMLMERITQSLAGRIAVLKLLPLSLKELDSVNEIDTDTPLFKGGYPAVWGKAISVQDVSRNYYETYIERDIRQLLNVK